jgi:hypothetical protein
MRNSLPDFKHEFLQSVLDGLWAQWSALGVPGHGQGESHAVIDPEALLLLTCSLGRYDARMFDEMLGWLVLHERLIDVQRLKNLLRDEDFAGGRVLSAIGMYLSAAKRGGVKWQRLAAIYGGEAGKPGPLFFSTDGEPVPVVREADPIFARFGLQREKVELRKHAQLFNPDRPANSRLRLRALFGVNSRAETVNYLLLHEQAGTMEIARATYYFKLTVYNTLAEMRLSGMVQLWSSGTENVHRLKGPFWEEFPRADWVNWAALFCVFEHVWTTLTDAERHQMDTVLLATELHQLEQKIVPLLHRAGLLAEFPAPSDGKADAYLNRFFAELKQLLIILH